MSFTLEEIQYSEVIERLFWSKRRPPVENRDDVREGQRISGQWGNYPEPLKSLTRTQGTRGNRQRHTVLFLRRIQALKLWA